MVKGLKKTVAVLGTLGMLGVGLVFAQNQTDSGYSPSGPEYGPKKRFHRQMEPQLGDPQKIQAFCKEIQPQWQKLWQIKRELYELRSKRPPDWSAIEKKETEFTQTKLEIEKKAHEMGLPYGPRMLRLRHICGW